MADIQLSGIGIVAINGSLGTTTFSRNAYGTYVKTRIGAPAGTVFLADWQTEVGNLTDGWENTLTNDQRKEWLKVRMTCRDTFGNKEVRTGFNLYMSINLNRFAVGQPSLMIPPVDRTIKQTTPPIFVTLNPSTFDITTSNSSGIRCAIYATKGLPVGRMSNNQIYALVSRGILSSSTFHMITAYTARLGAPIPGTKIFLKIVPIFAASGLRGVAQYTDAIV